MYAFNNASISFIGVKNGHPFYHVVRFFRLISSKIVVYYIYEVLEGMGLFGPLFNSDSNFFGNLMLCFELVVTVYEVYRACCLLLGFLA